MIVVTSAMAVLAIYKHRENIRRLLEGTEHRMGTKRAEEGVAK
jgi:glycerol-3-phosphate acyltransferase PlsY